jgi:ABC-type Fe3+-hydroxamate transport system substrate-binding protein
MTVRPLQFGTRSAAPVVSAGRRTPARVAISLCLLVAATRAQTGDLPHRIVSLVPSVTETLFAIGAGPQVVAVSSYDREPPEVSRLPRVGALIDPDVERILSLRPDLVVAYGSQTDLREQMRRAGIRTWAFVHAGLADVTRTIRELGSVTGRADQAETLATSIERQLASVRASAAGRPRPRVLLVFGREPLALRNIYASGGTGFLHDLVETAGGTNVFADVPRESVQATTELILARAPDVIIELRAEGLGDESRQMAERGAWSTLASVPAVRRGRIYFLEGSEFVVPGPRIARAARRVADVLVQPHPAP